MINKIKSFIKIAWSYIKTHKIKSSIALVILIIATFFGSKFIFGAKDGETRYIMAAVSKGNVEQSISGTGQVEAAGVKEVSSEASGKITYLNPSIKVGSSVKIGSLIAIINNADAQRSVKSAEQSLEDAKDNLETAQMDLDDLIGTDESNPKVKQDAEKTLKKSCEDGYNDVSSTFLDLPAIMKNLDSVLHSNTYNSYQKNIDHYAYGADPYDATGESYKIAAENSYNAAREAYDESFARYKASNIYSDTNEVSALISDTYTTTKLVAQALKDAINLIQLYEDILTQHSINVPSTADSHLSSLSSNLSTANSNISKLFSDTTTIDNNVEAVENSTDQIRTAKLTLKSRQQALETAEDNLASAKETLGDYYIFANLSGTISAVNAQAGDRVSNGTSIATIITTSKIASITMSETDIANIKVGDKARLTFDAVEGAQAEGVVSQVDVAGAANSGVVSYGLEISFDTDNEAIKPGMSTSATIVTNLKENVLMLPSAAVKEANGSYFVQALGKKYDLTDRQASIRGVTSDTAPESKEVQVGLVGDEYTEIISGLEEQDQVVLRVSASQTTTTSSSSGSNGNSTRTFNIQGGGGGSFTGPGI